MKIYISVNDGVPIYLQIISQIKHLVAAGRLKSGQELPPIRLLAQQLLINPNTVARAYRELEAAGIVTSRRGAGTHVSDEGSPLARKERLKILNDRIDALLAEASQLEVDFEQLTELIEKRRKTMYGESRGERL
jgi:GntR family transcriptional regulator